MSRFPALLLLMTGLILTVEQSTSFCGDWPQILGPKRNGSASGERLLRSWPSGKPVEVWQKRDLGSGFAGVAVSQGQLFLFHRVGIREIVESLDARTGKSRWVSGFETEFQPTYTSDNGPRCVPVVHGDKVIVYGAQGGLRTLDRTTGRTLWERDTHGDFRAQEGYFGAGSTPVVEGDLIIVNVGGRKPSSGVVAFDLKSGKTVWQASDEQASYSSPIVTTIGEERVVIVSARLKTLGLRVRDGEILFEIAFGQRGPTVNGACPVVIDGHLFLTASYGIGAVYGSLGTGGFEEIWRNDELLSSQYATPVVHKGHLIGIHGRQDVGTSILRNLDPTTQKFGSMRGQFPYGSLIKAGSLALFLDCEGELALLDLEQSASPVELARALVQESTPRGYRLPALSEGMLFIRDEQILRCLRVGQSTEK